MSQLAAGHLCCTQSCTDMASASPNFQSQQKDSVFLGRSCNPTTLPTLQMDTAILLQPTDQQLEPRAHRDQAPGQRGEQRLCSGAKFSFHSLFTVTSHFLWIIFETKPCSEHSHLSWSCFFALLSPWQALSCRRGLTSKHRHVYQLWFSFCHVALQLSVCKERKGEVSIAAHLQFVGWILIPIFIKSQEFIPKMVIMQTFVDHVLFWGGEWW